MPVKLAIDFDAIRIALVDEVQRATETICIVAEPETQNEPRPCKPYFSLKMVGPSGKVGDDSDDYVLDNMGQRTTVHNKGGQRKVVVDFNCYGKSHEQAYSLMATWQAALEKETVQERLYTHGIAVWLNAGSVNDVSQLLNTAYEGRSQLEVHFGTVSNVTEDLGEIDTINVNGQVTDGVTIDAVDVVVTAP